ncbi:MAG: molybdopterin-binding protein [Desulfobacula sp.]|nr:molybdopterin-binding protein [Desulfobacula sp.]
MKYYEKDKLKAVPVQDAVGKILLHDITQIVPDIFKGPSFKKGHLIKEADVEKLLNLGKEHIYVACLNGEIHENDAAIRIANAALGNNITLSSPNEGKVGFTAKIQGLLKINVPGLMELNSVQDVIFSSLHTNQMVSQRKELAGTRVIPLSTDENNIIEAEKVCEKYFPIIDVKPFTKTDVGMVITGSEVYSGRIKDGFGPVVQKKFEELGSKIMEKKIVSDELDMTVSAIKDLIEKGAGMIAVTGGMSVDPDDLTPAAIRAAGGEIVSYGAPVLPGAMFMLAYINKIPVIGLPGCVMYYRASIFDLVVPRLLAGEKITKTDIIQMGHGGFCSSCKTCRFPSCSFGK